MLTENDFLHFLGVNLAINAHIVVNKSVLQKKTPMFRIRHLTCHIEQTVSVKYLYPHPSESRITQALLWLQIF